MRSHSAVHGGGRRGAVDSREGEDAGHHGGGQGHEAQIGRLQQGDECQRQQVCVSFLCYIRFRLQETFLKSCSDLLLIPYQTFCLILVTVP